MNTIKELQKDINLRLETNSIDEVKEYVWDLLTKEDTNPKYTEQDYITARGDYYRLGSINTYSLTVLEQIELTKEYNKASCKYFTIKAAMQLL